MIEKGLIARIIKFCQQREMSQTQFGIKTVNDPNLVTDLEEGRELRRETRARVVKYLKKRRKKTPKAS